MTGSDRTAAVALTDRVSDVIARDEALVDVFVRAAPHFSKLRNRAMRRVMARLITVEQAARTAGISPDTLVRELNAALGIVDPADAARSSAAKGEVTKGGATPEPGGLDQPGGGVREGADAASPTRPVGAPVREVDVREDLRAGNEPFSKIMAAVATLGDGEILRLRATFEPVPLFAVLGKRGFVHESEEHAAEDWSVWFWRPVEDASTVDASSDVRVTDTASVDASPGVEPAPDPAGVAGVSFDDTTIVLDVRGLEPPEPLLRTLAALESLPQGHQLLQINARVPQFLFPMLVERGFACDVDESHADRVLVRIWRPA
jgi:uncharacterized protein (DUF2249 family)